MKNVSLSILVLRSSDETITIFARTHMTDETKYRIATFDNDGIELPQMTQLLTKSDLL